MRILFLGDIVGKPGRTAVCENIRDLRESLKVQYVIANAENASGGIGLTPNNALQLYKAGIEVLTSGNHIWKHKEIYPFLQENVWLLRPANYPPEAPGRGYACYELSGGNQIAVINLMGRTFMNNIDCPFRLADAILQDLPDQIKVIIVDFHAEATSEKRAMLFHLGEKVSAVIGTHTHVQTNDTQIFRHKTGYITDAGMTGPIDSILGMDPQVVLKRFIQGLPQRFTLAEGDTIMQGVILDIDESTGWTRKIEAWQKLYPQ